MTIVSLVPEAAEILRALGLGTETVTLPGDAFRTPEQLAGALERIRPSLIFASETVAGGAPRKLARRAVSRFQPRPAVYALEPHTVGDILSDIKTVGDATGHQRPARALIEALRARIDAVSLRSARDIATHPPVRVACVAAIRTTGASMPANTNLTAAGWWLAELVGIAGGVDVLGGAGRPPRTVTWAEIVAARPDLTVQVDAGGRLIHSARHTTESDTAESAAGAAGFPSQYPSPGPGAIAMLEQLADLFRSHGRYL